MNKTTYKATICFDIGSGHPDAKDAKGLEFTDTYSFFNSRHKFIK